MPDAFVTTLAPPPSLVTTLALPASLVTTLQNSQGPAGAPGAGGDSNYTHDQMTASALWSVTHSLGKFPSVTVVDSAGDACEGFVRYLSADQLTIAFSAAFGGHAYLN